MRLLTTIFTFALIAMGICELANAQRGGSFPRAWHDTNPNTNFWVDVGGAVFDRPGISNNTVVLADSISNQILLTIEDITDQQTSFGTNVAFGGVSDRIGAWDAEATIVNFDTDTSFTGDNLFSPLFNATELDSLNIDYDSDLASVEFNFRRPLNRSVTVFAGPRYFRLEEDIVFDTAATVGGMMFTSQNDTRTTSSMIGAQIGGEFRMQLSQSIFVRTHGKFAGFANRIEFSDNFSNSAGFASFTERDQTVASFIGEVGGRVIHDIVPGALQSYVGYEASWLGLSGDDEGVGAGPAAVDNQGDAIFIHQILFGFTISR